MNIQHDERELAVLALVRAGVFRIDVDGSVWRCQTRTRTGRWRAIAPRRADELKSHGYRYVRIEVDGVTLGAMAHRLVWLTLVGAIPDGAEINHKDGKRDRNLVDNLEPLTHGENQQHAYRELGRVRMSRSRNGRAVLSDEDVGSIRAQLAGGDSHRSIAKRFGVTHRTVGKISRGESWRPA